MRQFTVTGGMCVRCEGRGSVSDFDLDQLFDKTKSLAEGALTVPGMTMDGWYGRIFACSKFFDMDKPIKDYSKRELDNLLHKEPTKINVDGVNLTYEGVIPRVQRSMLSKDAATKILDRLHDVGLGYLRIGQPLTTLSGGERQRLKLATHMREKGGTYVLDEPTTGQDPARARMTRALILRLKTEGKTVFLTTHNMAEADEICDRIGFLARGQIPVTGSPEALKREYGDLSVDFDLWNGESDADPLMDQMIAHLRETGLLVEDDGAQVVHVAKPGETRKKKLPDGSVIEAPSPPPLLVISSEGSAMYGTTDLATILDRKNLVQLRARLGIEALVAQLRRASAILATIASLTIGGKNFDTSPPNLAIWRIIELDTVPNSGLAGRKTVSTPPTCSFMCAICSS